MNFPAGEKIFEPAYLSKSSMNSISAAADAILKLPPMKDRITVKTSLFSTLLSQDINVINLINWRTGLYRNRSAISQILKDMEAVGEMEIIKFYPAVVYALFDIFSVSSQTNTKLCELVTPSLGYTFEILVIILNVGNDPRFKSDMDQTENILFERLKELPANNIETIISHNISTLLSDTNGEGKKLRQTVKVLHMLFKIIIKTSISPKKYIWEILENIAHSMSGSSEHAMIFQVLMLQHLPELLKEAVNVFPEGLELLMDNIIRKCFEIDTSRMNVKIHRMIGIKSLLSQEDFYKSRSVIRLSMSSILVNLVESTSYPKLGEDGSCK
jgi:hypothetical protein